MRAGTLVVFFTPSVNWPALTVLFSIKCRTNRRPLSRVAGKHVNLGYQSIVESIATSSRSDSCLDQGGSNVEQALKRSAASWLVYSRYLLYKEIWSASASACSLSLSMASDVSDFSLRYNSSIFLMALRCSVTSLEGALPYLGIRNLSSRNFSKSIVHSFPAWPQGSLKDYII